MSANSLAADCSPRSWSTAGKRGKTQTQHDAIAARTDRRPPGAGRLPWILVKLSADLQVPLGVSDNLSGMTKASVSLKNPTGIVQEASASWARLALVPPHSRSTFPKTLKCGLWTITSLFLAVADGNTLVLDFAGVARLASPAA
jgi:hypothetical protein